MKHTHVQKKKKKKKKKRKEKKKKKHKKLDNIYVLVYLIPKALSTGEKIRLNQSFNKTNALIMLSTFQKRLNFKVLHVFTINSIYFYHMILSKP